MRNFLLLLLLFACTTALSQEAVELQLDELFIENANDDNIIVEEASSVEVINSWGKDETFSSFIHMKDRMASVKGPVFIFIIDGGDLYEADNVIKFMNSREGRSFRTFTNYLVDDMTQLQTYVRPFTLAAEDVSLLNEHLQGKFMFKYEGAILSSNRGLLHIHDAFGLQGNDRPNEHDYKPLLMLLGSGKVNLESTQASLDNTVIMTTNLEEMQGLERQLTSSKLLDRIERVPVNYLLDCVSEMDILNRDMANVLTKYDIDPNLFRLAAYYSVMTRLHPPQRKENFPKKWTTEKITTLNSGIALCRKCAFSFSTLWSSPHCSLNGFIPLPR